jgi:hypothetical protein
MSDEISLNCWIIDDLPPDDRAFSVGYEHRPPEGLHQGQEQAYLPTRTLTPDLSFSRVSIPRGQCVIGTCQKSRRGQGFVQTTASASCVRGLVGFTFTRSPPCCGALSGYASEYRYGR